MNETYRILAEGRTISNDTRTTGLNNNDLIIGPSGSGKTRGYVKPNILQCNESMIITDTKNCLKQELEGVLKKNGYQIVNVDFTDCAISDGYNPLDYIRFDTRRGCYKEQDILAVSACITPVENAKEPFWDLAARMVLESIIGYVMECLPDDEHTMNSVAALFMEIGNKTFERLFMELGEINRKSFAASRYRLYKNTAGAEKMYASIQGVLAEKLSPLTFQSTKELFEKKNRIHFERLGEEKTAVFLNISDTDRSLDRLADLFYTQAFQCLCAAADKNPQNRLAVPVRLILDDFAANTCIPDFDKIISIIRSREISVSIVLQSISQLEALYGHERALTILNNCDNCLYLGGQDVETARYISIKANKSINTILDMPLDSAWLFTRGLKPQLVKRYDVASHERYPVRPEWLTTVKKNPLGRMEAFGKLARENAEKRYSVSIGQAG